MLRVDFKKYKKVASDENSSTLVSPEGHEIKIAHPLLSERMRNEIKNMPMSLSKGGESPEGQADSSDQADDQSSEVNNSDDPTKPIEININTSPSPQQALNDKGQPFTTNAERIKNSIMGGASEAVQSLPPMWSPQNAQNAANDIVAQNAPAPSPDNNTPTTPDQTSGTPIDNGPRAGNAMADNQPQTPNPFLNPDYAAGYQKAFDEAKLGLQQQYGADVKSGQIRQQATQDYLQNISDQNDLSNGLAMNMKELIDEQNKVVQDDKTGHVHPNQYLENMGTGQRIATAIGLILGGMGGGLTHTENPAMKFLNDQIQRDVYSQESNIKNNQNLLSAYERQFNDIQSSRKMAMATQYALYSAKFADAANQTSDMTAKARLLQGKSYWDQQQAKFNNEIAVRRMALQGLQGGQNSDPATQISSLNKFGLISPKDKDQALKELGDLQTAMSIRDHAINNFDTINNSFLLKNHLKPGEREALIGAVSGEMEKRLEGRYNENAVKRIENLYPTIGDAGSTTGTKRNELYNLFDGIVPTSTLESLKRFGVKIPGSSNHKTFNEMAPVKR